MSPLQGMSAAKAFSLSLIHIYTIDVLLIEKGHVALDGFEYGFLGGASGCIENTVYFNGDLSKHPDFEKICRFIESQNCRVRYFEGEPLADIGSVIYLP